MTTLALTLEQIRYVNRAYWRNPTVAFFTFALPLMFLVIFSTLLGHGNVRLSGRLVPVSTYYVGSMAAWGVISACYTNVAISITFQRDAGILKRTRGTPLPTAAYLAARVAHSTLTGALLVVLTAAFGAMFYKAALPTGSTMVEFVVMFLVGAASFSALGFASTVVIPNSDAAPAIVNAIILPLLFLSGVFIPLGSQAPAWLLWLARIFPVHHFAAGMQAGFLGTPFHWANVLLVAAWGAAGLIVAIRHFRWEPRR